MTLVSDTLAASKQIKDGRTQDDVFKYMMTEVGELAMEMCIRDGFTDRLAGEDGVVGEAIDIIACALDIIYLKRPDITDAELEAVMQRKLAKWINKVQG